MGGLNLDKLTETPERCGIFSDMIGLVCHLLQDNNSRRWRSADIARVTSRLNNAPLEPQFFITVSMFDFENGLEV